MKNIYCAVIGNGTKYHIFNPKSGYIEKSLCGREHDRTPYLLPTNIVKPITVCGNCRYTFNAKQAYPHNRIL